VAPPRKSDVNWTPVLPLPSGAAPGSIDQLLANVPEADRTLVRAMFVRASGPERVALVQLISSLRGVAPADATTILALADALCGVRYDEETKSQGSGAATLPLVALAIGMRDRVMGTPRLLAPGVDGVRALDHLSRLLHEPIDPGVQKRIAPLTGKEVLAGLVQEIADPRRINQAQAGTCTVTSVQSAMALTIPGEYARLVVALAIDGSVRLANGKLMLTDYDGIDELQTRTASERIFQGSLMQWAGAQTKGNYVAEDGGRDGFFVRREAVLWSLPLPTIFFMFLLLPLAIIMMIVRYDKLDSGLSSLGMRDAAAAVMGEPYQALGFDHEKDVVAQLRRLRPDLRFDADDAFVTMGPFAYSGRDASHALVLVAVDDTCTPPALILRNPWGSDDTKKKGERISLDVPPDIVCEDPAAGLIRVPMTPEHQQAMGAVIAPKRMFVV
jgi:hypothetical protein